jgi:WD40 repeat protein
MNNLNGNHRSMLKKKIINIPQFIIVSIVVFSYYLQLHAMDIVSTPSMQIGYGVLFGLKLSPDGKQFATGSSDGKVRIWDANTGKVMKTCTVDDTTKVEVLAFSPDGEKVLVTVGHGQYIGWLSISTGKTTPIFTLPEDYNPNYGKIQMTDDASMILITGIDSVRIWNSECNKVLYTFEYSLGLCGLSPDGSKLLTSRNTDKNTPDLKLYELITGSVVTCRIDTIYLDGFSPAFSPAGDKLLIPGWGYSTLHDSHTGVMLDSFPYLTTFKNYGYYVLSDLQGYECAFSKSGSQILIGDALWDLQTKKLIKKFYGTEDLCTKAAFFPDDQKIVLSRFFGIIDVFTTKSMEAIFTNGNHALLCSQQNHNKTPIDFSPDGTRMLTGADLVIREWDIKTGEVTKLLQGHYDYVNSVAYSSDGKYILSGSDDYTAILWNAATYKKERIFKMEDEVLFTDFSADGSVAITMTQDTLKFWNISTGAPIKAVRAHEEFACMTPDKRVLYTNSSGRYYLKFWNPQTGDSTKSVLRNALSVPRISPDGTLFVSDSLGCLVLWSTSTAQRLKVIKAYHNYIRDYAFSPDGSLIVSLSEEDTVKIWKKDTGELLRIFTGYPKNAVFTGFTKDGTNVFTIHDNDVMLLWNVNDLVKNKKESPAVRSIKPHVTITLKNKTLMISTNNMLLSAPLNITLYTMSGKLIQNFRLKPSEQKVFHLSPAVSDGVYFYRVTGENCTNTGLVSSVQQ